MAISLRVTLQTWRESIKLLVCVTTAGTFGLSWIPYGFGQYLADVLAGFALVHVVRKGNPGMRIEFRHVRAATLYAVFALIAIGFVVCLGMYGGLNSSSDGPLGWPLAFVWAGFKYCFRRLMAGHFGSPERLSLSFQSWSSAYSELGWGTKNSILDLKQLRARDRSQSTMTDSDG